MLSTDRSRNRPGFVLAIVLIATLMIAVLGASLQGAVWRATRSARLGFAGERALHAADAAVARQVALWDAHAFASMPIGARSAFNPALSNTLSASVTLVRTSVNGALIEAIGTSTHNGIPQNTERRVARVLTVRNAPLKLDSPLTLLGHATFAGTGTVTTADETPTGWTTECAGLDSVDALINPVTDLVASRAQFDAHWHRWLSTAIRSADALGVTSVAPSITGIVCVPGTGELQRGSGSVAACANEWGARAITNAWPLYLTGTSRHQGVMMVDGDLHVTADFTVAGLLMVRGAIDDRDGHLRVLGAALVRDELGHGSRFGIATRVRYSRCALRRALSATGAPAAITTRGWMERF